MDTATTGISERFDHVPDGGAGRRMRSPDDQLYYYIFAFSTGAGGIFRVYDKRQADRQPVPDRYAPPTGSGFPRQAAATGDTQANPGPGPAPAYNPDGSIDTNVVSSTANPCPSTARLINHAISIFSIVLPTAPFADISGVVYSLTTDRSGILAGTKKLEPLVIRANKGDSVKIKLPNQTTAGSRYGGIRAGVDLGVLLRNRRTAAQPAAVLRGRDRAQPGHHRADRRIADLHTYYADRKLGTTLFQNLGSTASLRYGASGMLIVEPHGSYWTDSFTDDPLGPTTTATQAIVRVPFVTAFREFAVMIQTTDQRGRPR